MSRIAFFGMSARGHLNPSIGVLQCLAADHDLTVYDYERTAPYLAGYGLATTTYESVFGDDLVRSPFERPAADVQAGVSMAQPERRQEFFTALTAEVEANVDRYVDLLSDTRPDVVVHTLMFPGPRYAAEHLGIPLVTAGSMAISPQAWLKPADPAVAERIRADFAVLRQATAPLQDLRVRLGLAGSPNPVDVFNVSRDLVLSFTSEEFQGDWDRNRPYRFVGPCLRSSAPTPRPARTRPRPQLFVSFGTQAEAGPVTRWYRTFAAAVADLDADILVATGHTLDVSAVDWPANVTTRPEVDQLAVLSESDAVICHGGFNTVHEALWFGLPTWALMMDNDHFVVGGRLAATGSGLASLFAGGSTGIEEMRGSVARLLDDADLRRGAAEVAAGFRRAGGSRAAADAIAGLTRVASGA